MVVATEPLLGTHAGQVHHNQVLVLKASSQVVWGSQSSMVAARCNEHDWANVRVAFAEFSVGNLLVVDGDVAVCVSEV